MSSVASNRVCVIIVQGIEYPVVYHDGGDIGMHDGTILISRKVSPARAVKGIAWLVDAMWKFKHLSAALTDVLEFSLGDYADTDDFGVGITGLKFHAGLEGRTVEVGVGKIRRPFTVDLKKRTITIRKGSMEAMLPAVALAITSAWLSQTRDPFNNELPAELRPITENLPVEDQQEWEADWLKAAAKISAA